MGKCTEFLQQSQVFLDFISNLPTLFPITYCKFYPNKYDQLRIYRQFYSEKIINERPFGFIYDTGCCQLNIPQTNRRERIACDILFFVVVLNLTHQICLFRI